MIKDINVLFLEKKIKVTHSVYKPFEYIPGLIQYTFHLTDKQITIQRDFNLDEARLYWKEEGKGESPLAKQLGESYERHVNANHMDSANEIVSQQLTLTLKNICFNIETRQPYICGTEVIIF